MELRELTHLQVGPDERLALEVLEVVSHQQVQENSTLMHIIHAVCVASC